jgi:hypothetical protein
MMLTLGIGAPGVFAQIAPDQDSLKGAGFTADNLYAIGFALKEMNPITAAHSDMAARVLRASAALGNANAFTLLAEMYLGDRIPLQSGENSVQEAITYMNLAWDKGSPAGYFDLGLLYYNVAIPGVSEETARGATVSFVPRDYDKAFHYFVAACEKGNAKACRWTGICYEQGDGTTQDFEKAAQTLSARRPGRHRQGSARQLAGCGQGSHLPFSDLERSAWTGFSGPGTTEHLPLASPMRRQKMWWLDRLTSVATKHDPVAQFQSARIHQKAHDLIDLESRPLLKKGALLWQDCGSQLKITSESNQEANCLAMSN